MAAEQTSTGLSHEFLAGGSEMAAVVRATDWSNTPLGPIQDWPQSLRTTVSLCLASNFPIDIIWGPDHTQIYNDGYRVICGEAHPRAMGESFRVTWASAWATLEGPFLRALDGETSFLENQRMFLTRNGYFEETSFTFSLSPIRDDSGQVAGIFHPVTETTASMLSERRTRALRDLNAKLAPAADLGELARWTAESLGAFAFDLPFVLFYEREDDGTTYRLTASHGLAAGTAASPMEVTLGAPSPWFVGAKLRSGEPHKISDIAAHFKGVACGPYEEPPNRAFVLPLAAGGTQAPVALVVMGVSPRLPFDDAYHSFYELLGSALSAALTTVRAREDERRRAEALAEIDRAKTAFFSNVSHEFRTPLTLMMAPLEELLDPADALAADQRERVALAYRNAQRLLKLVNTLLDFSRLEVGRVQMRLEPTDLAGLTAELASNFRSTLERAGLDLVVDAPPLPFPVHVDHDMWEKVVLNLLSNAFKFTFEGEVRVQVASSPDGRFAELTVADTGTGIPPDALPHLFDRFYRVEGAQGRSFEGTGIGLALVRELVRLHGGEIGVVSRPGAGSAFTVSLPVDAAQPALPIADAAGAAVSTATRASAFVQEAQSWLPDTEQEPAQRAARPATGKMSGRILLADDNADMRAYVRRLLSAEGFDVEAVGNGEAALGLARRLQPDLILSDVMMPGLDGFGLLAALRADPTLAETPFILLSARAGEEARVEGLDAGADDYLTKPFAARELIARVSANLNLARDRREAALRALAVDLEQRVLEHSRERGRMWHTSPELFSVIDLRQARFDTVNPAWTATLGWRVDEIEGVAFADFVHPEDADATAAAFEQVRGGDPVLRFENRYRSKDGEWRWLSWVAVPEGDKLYSTSRDVTEAKARDAQLAQAQEALRQSQKMEAVGQLTGGIAHDFNNLLAGISGSLELLEKRIGEGRLDAVTRYVSAAKQSTDRASALTQRLLAFSRRQTLDPKPVDANRLIKGMENLIRRTTGPGIEVEVVGAIGLWPVLVDPNQLENALLNLCINARDAMPNGGRLTVETANKWLDPIAAKARDLSPGQYISLSVSDTGTGMSQEVIDRAFDPFFTTKPLGQGTGLGLSMIYGFARQSNGQVRIYSEVGQGTTMGLYFPRYGGTVADLQADRGTSDDFDGGSHGETILIIDDDEIVRMLVVDLLNDVGYRTLEAFDGPSGLKLLESGTRIDLLVTDVGLPGGLNGRQVADAGRAHRPDLKVLFITGYAENAVVGNGHLDPGMQVITKPFAIEVLGTKVRAMIDG